MTVVQLTASMFYGGPERQMLGLANSLPPAYRTVLLSFAEWGLCRPFLDRARWEGFEAFALKNDTPHVFAAVRELTDHLRRLHADLLCCHGYKSNLLGRLAARRAGIPVVGVSRGWTSETRKVRLFEAVDRFHLRWMDRVICVSEGQALKVRRAGTPPEKVTVIHNAIRTERFAKPDPAYRERLHAMYSSPRSVIIGAAGRLSPEKGFAVLVEAAGHVVKVNPTAGFVLFGDGALRGELAKQIADAGLEKHFVLGKFCKDLDGFVPFFDLLAVPSFTEGLPNVVLEAFAARVPVVATAVGGNPEIVDDGLNGYLVPAGDARSLADRILDAVASEPRRQMLGQRGCERVERDFSFEAQSRHYQELYAELLGSPVSVDRAPPRVLQGVA
jgi:glycosyltransferase involved in cell wall biosynthesis